MIVQVVKAMSIAKDSLTRYIVIPLMWRLSIRGRNLSRHSRSKRKRTEVISDNLSQPCYYIVNGDCLNRNAVRLSGHRPVKIRHGNGVSVVVRAGESPVHGEGKQLIILIQLTENMWDMKRSPEKVLNSLTDRLILLAESRIRGDV